MIETLCGCGKSINAPVSTVGSAVVCGACRKSVRISAGEPIFNETALGDFDARLIVTAGPDRVGETFALGGAADIALGKANTCEINLTSTMVSRLHAKLIRVDFGPARWKVVDTNSRNGILINGQRVTEAEFNHNDTVQIGDYTLKYVVGYPPVEDVTQTAGVVASTIKCRGCRTIYPAKTVICMNCGINLQTGKALVTAKHIDENDMAIRADTWIRIISLFIWVGLYPVASEALGTYKTRMTWIITGVTVFVSAFFILARISNHGEVPEQLKNYMLWVGKPVTQQASAENFDRVADRLIDISNRDSGHPLTEKQIEARKQFIDGIRQIAARQQLQKGEFHWYQLLTNTLLHGGIMHLAGNMLFLIVFGLRVNELIGDLKMAIIYPLLAICSGGVYAIMESNGPLQPCIGASGAIMGLAGMYFVFFPVHRVHMAIWFRGGIFTGWRVLYKLFTMKGFWLLVLLVGLNDVIPTAFRAAGIGSGDRVAHWAHLGGFASGALIATVLLLAKQVDARGADLFSIALGPRAWAFIGKPGDRSASLAGATAIA